MQLVDTVELTASLKKRMLSAGQLVVAIDGKPGAGKTWLSHCVACALSFGVISLDAYLRRNTPGGFCGRRSNSVTGAAENCGTLDDIRMYDRVLSARETRALFAAAQR